MVSLHGRLAAPHREPSDHTHIVFRWLVIPLMALVAAESKAQNYSANIVGYSTVTVAPNYNLLVNPFNSGVTNGANEIMPILDGEEILTWTGSRYAEVGYDSGFGGWVGPDGQSPAAPPSLSPGEGFFMFNPGQTTNFTFVGEVGVAPGGTNCISLSPGYSLVGSLIPATVAEITNAPVSLPVIDGMLVYEWSGSGYLITGFDSGFGGWVGLDGVTPSVAPPYSIGQGFFLHNPSTSSSWCQHLPYVAGAGSPSLSVTRVAPASVQVSWPTNVAGEWKLMHTTNLVSAGWQLVTQAPVISADSFVVAFPITNLSEFFLLQKPTSCTFTATPPVISPGGSSVLTWCTQPGVSYYLSPGPGAANNGTYTVSPTATTLYTLIASNAMGSVSNFATVTVITGSCPFARVAGWDGTVNFSYEWTPSTDSYTFAIRQEGHLSFHLKPTTVLPNFVEFTGYVGGNAQLNDELIDHTEPPPNTTTFIGSGAPQQDPGNARVSLLTLDINCATGTYSFTIDPSITATETGVGSTITSLSPVGTVSISQHALPAALGTLSGSGFISARGPLWTGGGDLYLPAGLGQEMFLFGVVNDNTAGSASVNWNFTATP